MRDKSSPRPSRSGSSRLKAGKLPAELLAELLTGVPDAPRVVLGAGIGRDAAVLDISESSDRLLVAKTDPITFATARIGWYAVNVNANDIACMGADPAWFLATVLLPEGSRESLATDVFSQIEQACEELGVTLVGGHTEVTIGIDRPIVAGCMLGEVDRATLIVPESAAEGDLVLLAQSIAIEGTALLALEASRDLKDLEVAPDIIERARGLLDDPGISVVRAAKILREFDAVHALHDPTEGGLVTALREIAAPAGLGLRLRLENVSVIDETQAICKALGLDPFGLLASGALLAAVEPSGIDEVTQALEIGGIPYSLIGELLRPEHGFVCDNGGRDRPLGFFERDELARYLAS